MEYGGADVYQRGLPGMLEIKFKTYTRKLKPVNLDMSRGAGARPSEPNELRM